MYPEEPASDRIAFPSATAVSALPFTSSLSFGSEVVATVSVPAIFTTAPLVAVNATTIAVASGPGDVTAPYNTGVISFTGAAAMALPTWPAVGLAVGGLVAAL